MLQTVNYWSLFVLWERLENMSNESGQVWLSEAVKRTYKHQGWGKLVAICVVSPQSARPRDTWWWWWLVLWSTYVDSSVHHTCSSPYMLLSIVVYIFTVVINHYKLKHCGGDGGSSNSILSPTLPSYFLYLHASFSPPLLLGDGGFILVVKSPFTQLEFLKVRWKLCLLLLLSQLLESRTGSSEPPVVRSSANCKMIAPTAPTPLPPPPPPKTHPSKDLRDPHL